MRFKSRHLLWAIYLRKSSLSAMTRILHSCLHMALPQSLAMEHPVVKYPANLEYHAAQILQLSLFVEVNPLYFICSNSFFFTNRSNYQRVHVKAISSPRLRDENTFKYGNWPVIITIHKHWLSVYTNFQLLSSMPLNNRDLTMTSQQHMILFSD